MKNLQSKIFIFLCCVSPLTGQAQEIDDQIRPLVVGDSIPELVFNNMINYRSENASLSDFGKKAVILDFWATWCVPCVESFPKLEKLQREFNEDLQILLLSHYDEKAIRTFYQNRKDLILPTAFYDKDVDIIYKLFPYKEIPHYIWIDASKRIYAITDASQVTEDNIQKFLSGKKPKLSIKNDAMAFRNNSGAALDSIVQSSTGTNKISINDKIVFQSMFMKYDPRLTTVELEGIKEFANKYVSLQNMSVIKIMQYALGYRSSNDSWRFYLDLIDTTLSTPSSQVTAEERKTWKENYSYTYRILLNRPDSAHLHKVMLRDLEWTFGLKSYRKKVKVPYLALRSIANGKSLLAKVPDTSSINYSIYNITLNNRPVKDLAVVLHRYQIGKPFLIKGQRDIAIFDETGIKGNIDLDIKDVNITNLGELNKKLRDNGLELVKKTGKLDMIVITDK